MQILAPLEADQELAGQELHELDPVTAEYAPCWHARQSDVSTYPDPVLYCPAAHPRQADIPMLLPKVPAGHATHESDDVVPN